MKVAAATNLACPIDGTRLTGEASLKLDAVGTLRCDRGHSFDRSREGYLNLLLVQHKASRQPGDSKEMVAARRRIHGTGLFEPLARAITAQALERMAAHAAGSSWRVLDAGCGEGFYLDRLAADAVARPDEGEMELAGADISKWAVQAAAKRKAPVAWLVANNRHLPLQAGSVDLILSLFGFAVWDGFLPVLAAGGEILLADPGPDHMIELRQVIYPEVKRTGPPPLAAAEAAGLVLAQEAAVRWSVGLETAQQIQDLVAMTPHASRMPAAGRDRLAEMSQAQVTMDVVLRTLRRRPAGNP